MPDQPTTHPPLAPLPIRLLIFALLLALAILSIRTIDRHAMIIQQKHGWTPWVE